MCTHSPIFPLTHTFSLPLSLSLSHSFPAWLRWHLPKQVPLMPEKKRKRQVDSFTAAAYLPGAVCNCRSTQTGPGDTGCDGNRICYRPTVVTDSGQLCSTSCCGATATAVDLAHVPSRWLHVTRAPGCWTAARPSGPTHLPLPGRPPSSRPKPRAQVFGEPTL